MEIKVILMSNFACKLLRKGLQLHGGGASKCGLQEQEYHYRFKQESVRPRWPYDMRPSVRAEKYIRDASGAEKT